MALNLQLPRKNGLFITGTDTGVGKTIVAGGIARILSRCGLKVGVFKPIASGCIMSREGLVSPDSEFLAFCAETDYPLSVITPVTFKMPAAPVTCIEFERRPMDYEAVAAAYTWICDNSDVVIVEGIGGAMVPLTKTETVLDLAVEFDLPTIIVARPDLGTINHTLLTLKGVRDAGLPAAGVVINGYNAAQATLAEETAPGVIASFGHTSILATVPYDEDSSVEEGRIGPAVLDTLDMCDWYSLCKA